MNEWISGGVAAIFFIFYLNTSVKVSIG